MAPLLTHNLPVSGYGPKITSSRRGLRSTVIGVRRFLSTPFLGFLSNWLLEQATHLSLRANDRGCAMFRCLSVSLFG